MSIRSEKIWMDGELVAFDEARVHVLSHTLHYGLGVFEGIRCYEQLDGRAGVFKLEQHLRRLFDSARMCQIKIPFTLEQVHEACCQTIAANGMKSVYIRPIVFLGAGAMGLGARSNQVHVAVAVWDWGRYLGVGPGPHNPRAQAAPVRGGRGAALQTTVMKGRIQSTSPRTPRR